MKLLIFALVIGLLLFTGCTFLQQQQANESENQTQQPPLQPPARNPSFTITSPANGDVITASGDSADVTLSISTQNLLLKQPAGAAKKGEGHFRVTVDGGTPVTVTTKIYILSGLGIGTHTIKVELMNNDRTPYAPSISQEITFTIEKEITEYVPQTYTVTINDFSYSPAEITVKVGDSITFVNDGAYPRSATSFVGGREIFNSGVLGPGQSATIRFMEMGTFEYYSVTHVAMRGTVVVESNGSESAN